MRNLIARARRASTHGLALGRGRAVVPPEKNDTADESVGDSDAVVRSLYNLILGRSADPGGLAHNAARIEGGDPVTAVAASLVDSQEFRTRLDRARARALLPPPPLPPGYIDPSVLKQRLAVKEHAALAESYFSGAPHARDHLLSKPFASATEASELVACFGMVLQGLQLYPGIRVLDFGVGSGWTSWMLTQMGCEVVACDVSASALQLLEERYRRWEIVGDQPPMRTLLFDGERLDLEDGAVQRICVFDAFHHVPNRDWMLSEFSRVLAPGGRAVFSEPGPFHSRTRAAQFEMANFDVVEDDISLPALIEVAAEVGLLAAGRAVFTAQPVWVDAGRAEWTSETGRLDDETQQAVADQMENRQLFVFRKSGDEQVDSRTVLGLACELRCSDVRFEQTEGSLIVTGRLVATNTGSAVWLESARELGGVRMGASARADGQPNLPSGTVALTYDLLLEPVQPSAAISIGFRAELPAAYEGGELWLDLFSSQVAWFVTLGTERPRVDLPGGVIRSLDP